MTTTRVAPLPSSIHLAIATGALINADASVTAERLRCLIDARQAIDAEIRAEVRGMRLDGQTWAVIGDALGVSRSAAQQRYGAWTLVPARRLRQ